MTNIRLVNILSHVHFANDPNDAPSLLLCVWTKAAGSLIIQCVTQLEINSVGPDKYSSISSSLGRGLGV